MCGIAGLLSANTHDLKGNIEAMTQALYRRGPDSSGVWVDDTNGLALGHRRLAVLDLSAAGHQPMQSDCGRYVLVFNGEIYNHLALRRKLEAQQPCHWRGHSDTETLLAYYRAFGLAQTLTDLNGMFAFAIWDTAVHTLVLARDRFGEKPLYYGWHQGSFLFGSTLAAIRAFSPFQAIIDRVALAQYVRYNYVPSPHSIYQGIAKLPASHYLELELASSERAQPQAYWRIADVACTQARYTGTTDAAVNELEQVLGGAVRQQMIADVPLGALLSGGIDSSLIAALMQQHQAQPINTFTIGFNNRHYDEAQHAKAVAKQLGSYHTQLYLSPQGALDLIPSLAGVYDEPFADSSQLATILVMQLAKAHVTVALSGDGADEVFGGYNRYLAVPALERRFGGWSASSRALLAKLLQLFSADVLNAATRPFVNIIGVAQLGDKAHKLAPRLAHADSVDKLYQALVSQWQNLEPIVKGAERADAINTIGSFTGIDDPVARLMLADSTSYLPDDILVKVDRAAMAVSLETRAPFLDVNVVEWAWALPTSMKIADGQGKHLLRQLLYRHVPEKLVNRPKVGFSVPLDQWLRGPLRDWAESLLAEQRLEREGFFYSQPIRMAWQDHITGRASNGYQLWSILMFQAWLEGQ